MDVSVANENSKPSVGVTDAVVLQLYVNALPILIK